MPGAALQTKQTNKLTKCRFVAQNYPYRLGGCPPREERGVRRSRHHARRFSCRLMKDECFHIVYQLRFKRMRVDETTVIA